MDFLIKDLIEKRCATFDDLMDADSRFFLEHPTAKRYIRPHFVGEFGNNNAGAEEVLVTKISVDKRMRSPLYAEENERRSPIVAVDNDPQSSTVTAKKKKRRSPKGRARDFRDFIAKR